VLERASRQRSLSFALGENASMTTTRLLMIFVPIIVLYSLLLFVIFRPLTRPEGVRFSQSRTPIETTTTEERSRGESSFVIRQELRFGISQTGFFVLSAFGYLALMVGFVIALFRSSHP